MQVIQKWLAESENKTVITILSLGLLVRCLLAFWLFPGYDEAYYYIYSHQLDWSYFDHPLMVALTTGLGVWLTGQTSQFTIRLGTLILYTGSLWLLYLIGRRLFNRQAAKLTLILASIIPIFLLVFGVFTLPDVPLIFFWSLALYCATVEFFPISEQQDQSNSVSYVPSYRLAILGVLMGLVCLSKYHGFVLGCGFILFCLTSPRYFKALLSPWFWLGVILFVITLFPLWYWNIQHDWISFGFQLSNRFKEPTHYNILGVLLAFIISIGVLFPPLGVPMWWVTIRSIIEQIPTFSSWKALLNKSQLAYKHWLILCVSLPLILGLMFFSGYHYTGPSWTMPGFWPLTLLLGEKAAQWEQASPRKIKRWLQGSTIFLVGLFLFVMLHLTLGILQKQSYYAPFGGLIPAEQDPSKEVLDMEQLHQAFINDPKMLEALNNSQFVFSNVWLLSGLIDIAIYPIKPIPVTCFCQDQRGFQIWFNPQDWIGKNGLYITNTLYSNQPELADRYRPYFQEFNKVGEIPIRRGGGVLEVFYVYQGKNLLKPYP